MRVLTVLVLLAFAGWSGWWWLAADQSRKAAEAWFASVAAEGGGASHGGISVMGYPNRVDLTVSDPVIADARSGWGWRADFLQLFAMTWKPWHLIAVLAPQQEIETPAGPLRVESDSLRASLVLTPGPDLALDRFNFAAESVRWGGTLTGAFDSLSVATRPSVGLALSHDLGVDLRGLMPDPQLLDRLPAGLLPGRIGRFHLDAVLGFTAPLDRHAGTTRPVLEALRLRAGRIEWGDLVVEASGNLTSDAQGFAEGRIEIRAAGWRKALNAVAALGALPPEAVPQWETALATLEGTDGVLVVPLVFAGGRASVAALPVGLAPRLRGR